jgi:DNA replication protein DnaD
MPPKTSDSLDNNLSTGYICLFRSMRKHWIWADAEKFKWWVDILLECNHKDKKVLIGTELILCKRGECIVSILTWSKRWRTTRSSVRRFLDLLESDSMIVRKSNSKTTHLTICNYETYNDKRTAKRSTNEHQTNIQVYTTNNDNNDKNVNSAVAQKNKSYKKWNREEFIEDLKIHKEMADQTTLNAFFKYWSEKSADGRMKFQLEKTWETNLRLSNWIRISETKRA